MPKTGTLYLFCGKMAAGKSTLARDLSEREGAILLVQDEWLSHLFPGDIVDVPTFAKFSARLRAALADHICSLLSRGMSIVLDFPGNTRAQRNWFRELFERANADHELHFVDVPTKSAERNYGSGAATSRRGPHGPVMPSSPRLRSSFSPRPPMRASRSSGTSVA
jgi:predicted kinase